MEGREKELKERIETLEQTPLALDRLERVHHGVGVPRGGTLGHES